MNRSSFPRRAAARLACAALVTAPLWTLTACGGGGGDGGSGGGGVIDGGGTVQGSLVITSANARAAAADALDNATNVEAARGGSEFLVAAQIDPVAAVTSPGIRLASAARALALKGAVAPALPLAVAVNQTLACTLGGTVTVVGNIASGSGLTAGDSFSITASGCREPVDGQTSSMSGSFSVTVASGSLDAGTPFPRRVVMGIRLASFGVAVDGESTTSTGDMNFDLTETGIDRSDVVLTGTSLASTVVRASGSRSVTMRNYRQAASVNPASTSFSVVADFETNNPRLGTAPVSYHVTMPAPIVVANVSGEVTSGSLRVAGDKSALLLTTTAPGSFSLQVDANGDGSFESGTTTTLGELRGLL